MELLSVFIVIAGFLIFSNPPVEERVILIPDADGKVGELFVTYSESSQTVKQAYMSIEVTGKNGIESLKQLNKDQVITHFSDALSAIPQEPSRYILYFKTGTTELTQESKKLINIIVNDVKSRDVYDIFIDGHTDTTGTSERNAILALERAKIVNHLFSDKLPEPEKVKVTSHGDGNLLVKTADGVDEPKNRRVEILIQ